MPVVTTLHGTDITIVGQDPSFHAITKFSIEKSDGLTAVSRFLQEETLTAFGCTACRIETIPNFIDPEVYDRSRYTPVLDPAMGSGRHVLMHISNFRPVKRIRDVVRVFARVAAEVPAVLVMVGDGPDRVDAEQEARALGVDSQVSFLGKIDAVAPLLAGADLFLLPSDRESFGLSALEALASGVPVIGARAGGLPEVVRDGETGFLCDVGDVDGMAKAAVSGALGSIAMGADECPGGRRRSRTLLPGRDRWSVRSVLRVHAGAGVAPPAARRSVTFDGHSGAELAARLGLPRIEVFDVIDSTQDIAHDMAAGGAPSGTLVLADSQIAGRGRLGRSWESQSGRGVWLTLIAREVERRALDVLSLRIGLQIAAALDALVPEPILLKWPNDLYLPTGKVGGILVESRWREERVDWLAIGVGINLRAPDVPDVPGAAGLGNSASRVEVLGRMIPAIQRAIAAIGPLEPTELAAFARRDMARGRIATAPIEGCVQGIDADGALVIETSDGCRSTRSGSLLLAGDL